MDPKCLDFPPASAQGIDFSSKEIEAGSSYIIPHTIHQQADRGGRASASTGLGGSFQSILQFLQGHKPPVQEVP